MSVSNDREIRWVDFGRCGISEIRSYIFSAVCDFCVIFIIAISSISVFVRVT